MTLLSADADPNTYSLNGLHSHFTTESLCPSKELSLHEVFLKSQKAIVLSSEPVKKRFSLCLLKSIEYISPV